MAEPFKITGVQAPDISRIPIVEHLNFADEITRRERGTTLDEKTQTFRPIIDVLKKGKVEDAITEGKKIDSLFSKDPKAAQKQFDLFQRKFRITVGDGLTSNKFKEISGIVGEERARKIFLGQERLTKRENDQAIQRVIENIDLKLESRIQDFQSLPQPVKDAARDTEFNAGGFPGFQKGLSERNFPKAITEFIDSKRFGIDFKGVQDRTSEDLEKLINASGISPEELSSIIPELERRSQKAKGPRQKGLQRGIALLGQRLVPQPEALDSFITPQRTQ